MRHICLQRLETIASRDLTFIGAIRKYFTYRRYFAGVVKQTRAWSARTHDPISSDVHLEFVLIHQEQKATQLAVLHLKYGHRLI